MDQIKEAFQKVKQDIDFLYSELSTLKREISGMSSNIARISEILIKMTKKLPNYTIKEPSYSPANQQINSTDPTHNPTHNLPLKPLKPQNMNLSTGNEGVPTDRQTNQQTDRHIPKNPFIPQNPQKNIIRPLPNSIDDAARILESLDSLKKEIRLKFKQLTDQEILVFSTLYQLEEEQGQVDYKVLATRLNLTESSIRDYIGRLLKKGIPVDKTKINNKQILLSISPNLKKIASLSTILQLRDI